MRRKARKSSRAKHQQVAHTRAEGADRDTQGTGSGRGNFGPASSGAVRSWRDGVLLPALASAAVLWAAFPPLNLGLLAWLAPAGWLLIAERQTPLGRKEYFSLWLSGCLFWLLILHGIRLAFWPLIFGWLALSLYLAIYVPLFVGVTRILRRRWHVPLVLAAPVAWVGLELIRSYMLSGYAANTLAHSQAHDPIVIQIADQLGGTGVSFVMMTCSAALFQLVCSWQAARLSSAAGPAAWALVLLVATLGYGGWRLRETDQLAAQHSPQMRVLLIQENTPTVFEINRERNALAWTRYLNATRAAAQEHGVVDLVCWPESTFTANAPWMETWLTDGVPAELARENVDENYLLEVVNDLQQQFRFKSESVLQAARGLNFGSGPDGMASGQQPHLLLGSDAWIYRSEQVERYNAALLVGPDGDLRDRYYKMHLVMFGEYIPLGPLLKWLGDAFGFVGIQAGNEVKSFRVGDVNVAPSICFESMMPRLISWQVRTLTAAGKSPDVLINITNDSWFRGSSMLDHHLACSIVCAAENRRPLLVAANTGLSAHIDGAGRVRQLSERFAVGAILAEPVADGRWGLVQRFGYPLAWLCAALSTVAAAGEIIIRRNLPDSTA